MARHAEQALGRQDHGGCSHPITGCVTSPAGLFTGPVQAHFMDAGNPAALLIPAPDDNAALVVLCRSHPLQVAGPAADPDVGIMGDFLCMRAMTVAAIPHLLFVVLEIDALGMADRAADPCVGCAFIFLQPYKRKTR